MNIQQLFAYSNTCRRLLQETLCEHPQVFDRPFETLAVHMSIRRLLAHIIGAEERWIKKYILGQEVGRYETQPDATLDEMFAKWDQVRAETMEFVNSVDPVLLRRTIPLHLLQWDYKGELTIEQILFHMINHETHHRAQISMALQQMQIEPPNFDYVFLHE